MELNFPTLEAAVRYVESQGLPYTVLPAPGAAKVQQDPRRSGQRRAHSDATLARLGLGHLRDSYGEALAGAATRDDPLGAEAWDDPMDVVADPGLTLDAKRSILMSWAWTEHLADQATTEGMPEDDRPSRLDEVEQALMALEGRRPGWAGPARLAA